MSARVSIWFCVLCALMAVAAVATSSGNNGNHNGWYQVKVERDFKKGAQPFNGKGQKSTKKLPIDSRTGMLYTGTDNRSAQWLALARLISINASGIKVWSDRPVPLAIKHVMQNGIVDSVIDNQTTVLTNVTCNRGGNNCKVIKKVKPTMAPEHMRIANHRVVQQGDRHEHVLKFSTVSGTCGVTAAISFTPDATMFSLLFDNFNVHTSKVNGQSVLQQTINCAFRVPITVPTGLTVAALSSQLRGLAMSSPQGEAGIAWTAGIGMELGPNTWADIYDESSYSARYWSGGISSGEDFDPITVAMELDSVNPTFSPCNPCGNNCPTSFDVPVDFQFTLNAVRSASETQSPHVAESLIFLDSQDTVKSITLNEPFAIDTC